MAAGTIILAVHFDVLRAEIFSYFYVSVQYDPAEQADNMKRYGGFIPGIRPGRPTAEYLPSSQTACYSSVLSTWP